MEKQTKNIIVGILIIGIIILIVGPQLGLFASVNGKEIIRSIPSVVSPGQTFTLSYIASGTSGLWGASIQDSVSGGCTFPSGLATYKTVMLSEDGNTKSIQITAPQSGTCIFSGGDFKFGTDAIGQMSDKTIIISASDTCTNGQTKCEGTTYFTCSNNAWLNEGQIIGKCGYTSGNGDAPNGDSEPPTFELGMVLFKLGSFEVTILYLLIGLGALFIIKLVFSK